MDRALTPSIWSVPKDADAATGPERKPMRAPVFIQDAMTPLGDETLLLKLLRDQSADQDE
ncbi:hypothetical protein [Ruegeria profundi]|uniref:Uncharacterized protein n=1 Tax=Ruegeria profundi TaxID=1685378 RepID=A0A0X3TT15_9RHOB|nr:hypothetical protein [Ruegeria profundi]KUJ78862.1 hypothetical protein AVO44_10755 [Ruegeria profundi]MCA0929488.1 hypothetical protein [Ruegeria profundi]